MSLDPLGAQWMGRVPPQNPGSWYWAVRLRKWRGPGRAKAGFPECSEVASPGWMNQPPSDKCCSVSINALGIDVFGGKKYYVDGSELSMANLGERTQGPGMERQEDIDPACTRDGDLFGLGSGLRLRILPLCESMAHLPYETRGRCLGIFIMAREKRQLKGGYD